MAPVRLNFLGFNLSSPTCAWNVFRPGESLAVHIYKIYGEGSPEAQQIVWGRLFSQAALRYNQTSIKTMRTSTAFD